MSEKPSYEELVRKITRLEKENLEILQLTKTVQSQEAELRENEEKFRLLFERTPLSYQSLDINGNFLEVNQAWLKTLGYAKDEVIGKNFADFLHPDWVDHFKENFPRFKAIGEVLGVEFEMRKKDGSMILVAFNGKIGKNPQGDFLQTHCIFNDITELRRSELALTESEHRHRVIFENSPLGMVRYDAEGMTLDCNEKFVELMGSTREKLVGVNLARQASPKMQEAIKKASAGEASVYEGAYTSITGGKTLFLRMVFNPVTPDRSPTEVIATAEDVSKRKLAEEVMERRILSLTQPLEDASGIVFEDLFNIDDIQRLQDEFAQATGVASIITRTDGTPITRPSNFTRLCNDIIRTTEKGLANCYSSDATLGRLSTEGPLVQPCMSGGLWDAGAGISVGGHHIANWLIGQVRDATQTEEEMRRYAREIGAEEEDFIKAFRMVPAMSQKHFEDIAGALFTLANRLSATAYLNVQQARIISEIKESQEKLRKSEDRLRFALEGANDGLWDANLLTGEAYLSRRTYEILGYAEGEMNGIFQNWRDLVHPDDFSLTWERLVAHFKKQTPILRVEHRMRMKDGSWKWLLTRGKVVEWGENGRALRMVGTNTDISERKKIEEAQLFLLKCGHTASGEDIFEILARYLAEHLQMDFVCISRLAGDNLSVRTLAFYFDGHFQENMTYAFQDAPCGYVIGKTVYSCTDNVCRQYPEDTMLQEMAAESYVGATLWDSHGKAIGLISVIGRKPLVSPNLSESVVKLVAIRAAGELERRDTEAEKANLQSQLMQAQKMESVGRLAGGVAHDFNNMLGVILGHVDLAQDQINPADPLYDDLSEVKKAAQRSADLTRQLLAFARKQTVSPKIMDLNETVEGLFKMLRRLIGEDIDLVWLPGKGLWPVKIDPSQVDQILANLTVNARDAIDGVGRITIETGNTVLDEGYCADHMGFIPGSYVILSVSDNGCGMNQEIQEHIFEPFYTTKGVGQGTGLGLATIYGIVKQNSGFINVYSEPGRGTTFRIYFPQYSGKVGAIDSDKVQALQQGVETILLVEDESAILRLGKRMLERLGYRVLAAGTPGEALRLAEQNPGVIDLLMTDVVMPEMNGRDLARRLLSLYPDIKRLFMSGYTADVIAHHGVLDEGVYFIQKPFSKAELSAKVREALRGEKR
jgi:two-component system, cell cycle sensor histidine kinase and response regulator CckA